MLTRKRINCHRPPAWLRFLGVSLALVLFGLAPPALATHGYAVIESTPSSINAVTVGQDLVVSGVAVDASAVEVSLDDDNDPATPPPLTTAGALTPASGAQTWTATFPAAAVSLLADGQLTADASFTVASGPIPSDGPLTILKDTAVPTGPKANPPAGLYSPPLWVELFSSEPTIFYTTDGTTPDEASPKYTGPIEIATTTTLRSIAIDSAGNRSSVTEHLYTIEATAPVVTIDAKPPDPTNNPDVEFWFSANDPGVIFECGLGFEAEPAFLEGCTSPAPYTLLSGDGSYTFKVQATDAAGNVGSASHTFRLDTVAPALTSQSPAPNASDVAVDTNVTVTFSEDVQGVSGSTFILKQGSTRISAAVSYDPTTHTATLDPSGDLAGATTYTAKLRSGISDPAGNTLAGLTWSFTTAGAPPPPPPPPGGAAIKTMTFESGRLTGADGADSTRGSVALVTGAAALKGTASAKVPGVGAAYLQENFTGVNEFFVSFYIKLHAAPTRVARLALITNSGTAVGNIRLTPTRNLKLNVGGTTVGARSAPLAIGTLYRIGIHQKKGTGGDAVLEAFLASGDDPFGAPFAATTTGTWTTQANRIRVGATTRIAINATFDNITLDAATMPGPSQ